MSSGVDRFSGIRLVVGSYARLICSRPSDVVSLSEAKRGWLRSTGWLESRRRQEPCDGQGDPIPWFTYSATEWLAQNVPSNPVVLEVGSGASTLWWLSRGAEVYSIETDPAWATRVERSSGFLAPQRAQMRVVQNADEVKKLVRSEIAAKSIDLLVVDGIEPRGELLNDLAWVVADNGMIVLDNSEREEYQQGMQLLVNSGYVARTFAGQGPINTYTWHTTIYQRLAADAR